MSQKNPTIQWFREVDQNYLKNAYGSPLWIVNEDQLINNIKSISRFTGSAERILYPVKTNPAPAVLEVLAHNGCGADCSNLSEINLALLCGFPWANIAYNSPYQDKKTCRIVLENGGILVIDDPEIIKFVTSLNGNYTGQVWLRINPATRDSYLGKVSNSDLMSHGEDSSKFGIPEEELEAYLKDVRFSVSGLHLHVGTQMNNLNAFKIGLASLHRLADILLKRNHPLKHIDIGGGLGIAFSKSDQFPSIEEWVDSLKTSKRQEFLYYTEPGHALVGDAVALLVSVKTIKVSRGRKWAVCDAGTDQLAKITLLHWPHRIWHEGGFFLDEEGNDALAGPLCFAGDNLLPNTNLKNVKVNDTVLVTKAGAYTFSLSNSFNGRSVPAWVNMKGERYRFKSMAEKPFARAFLQHHLWQEGWGMLNQKVEQKQINQLLSPYLQNSIQKDDFTILSITRISINCYESELDIQSDIGFVSMPTAIRAIGNACIIAILHKYGFKSKDRPVIGKKLDIEYNGQFKTGLSEVRFSISEDIKKNGEQRTLLVSFETSNKVCIGAFIVNF